MQTSDTPREFVIGIKECRIAIGHVYGFLQQTLCDRLSCVCRGVAFRQKVNRALRLNGPVAQQAAHNA